MNKGSISICIISFYSLYLLLLIITYLIILNQLKWSCGSVVLRFVDVLLILCFVLSQTIRFKAVLLSWQMEEVVPQSRMWWCV